MRCVDQLDYDIGRLTVSKGRVGDGRIRSSVFENVIECPLNACDTSGQLSLECLNRVSVGVRPWVRSTAGLMLSRGQLTLAPQNAFTSTKVTSFAIPTVLPPVVPAQ